MTFTNEQLMAALAYLIHNEALAYLHSGGMEVVTCLLYTSPSPRDS